MEVRRLCRPGNSSFPSVTNTALRIIELLDGCGLGEHRYAETTRDDKY
jgi:hypothetical protein